MQQGTRDTRRGALTAGLQSSVGEAPGSAHGSAAARSAPGGHRASRPAAAAATPGSLRHRQHGKLATSGAAAAAHIGPTGRDGEGRGGDSA